MNVQEAVDDFGYKEMSVSIEHEGADDIRFDYNGYSIWFRMLSTKPCVEGTFPKSLKNKINKFAKKQNIKNYVEYI